MIFDRWRAQRAIATRSAPMPVNDAADPRLFRLVEDLKAVVAADESLGDPSWHYRWDGDLQLVGLDARTRSTTDVRQRLMRLVHECDLRHLTRRRRRVFAVVLCRPRDGEGLVGWHERLRADGGEVGVRDWRAGRRRIAVLAADEQGGMELFGGDAELRELIERWRTGQAGSRAAAGP